ncbi:7121_t:CDS:2, partial [Funneliformis caledonium]
MWPTNISDLLHRTIKSASESLHHSRNTSAINPLDPNLHANTQLSHSTTSRNPLSTLNSSEVYANDELDAEVTNKNNSKRNICA